MPPSTRGSRRCGCCAIRRAPIPRRPPQSDPSVWVTHRGRRYYVTGAPHVDSGFLTLLAQDGVDGLQARHRNGQWTRCAPAEGTLAVNFGKVLERWSAGRIKATEHRVIGAGRREDVHAVFLRGARGCRDSPAADGSPAIRSNRSCTAIICGRRRRNSSSSREWSRCAPRCACAARLEPRRLTPHACEPVYTDASTPPLFASSLADRFAPALHRLATATRARDRRRLCGACAAIVLLLGACIARCRCRCAARDRLAWAGLIASDSSRTLFVMTLLRDLVSLLALVAAHPAAIRGAARAVGAMRRRAHRAHHCRRIAHRAPAAPGRSRDSDRAPPRGAARLFDRSDQRPARRPDDPRGFVERLVARVNGLEGRPDRGHGRSGGRVGAAAVGAHGAAREPHRAPRRLFRHRQSRVLLRRTRLDLRDSAARHDRSQEPARGAEARRRAARGRGRRRYRRSPLRSRAAQRSRRRRCAARRPRPAPKSCSRTSRVPHRAAARAGFDVQISGHTHGGQFWPWNHFVRYFQPFTAGLHRLKSLWVYVSRGTGYWGPPNRFGVPSEITRIRLVNAAA